MCRFCLTQNESLRSLYDRNQTSKNSVNLNLKILSCVSMEVYPSDHTPTFICDRCKFFMNLFYEYKQIVRQADETILQYLQHGSPMEIITWPTSLTNVFQSKVVKTIVESGATVQVTSQDNSDSDDDEGNVYNVKIGDMPDEASTACVKVVTGKDDKDIEDSNARGKGFGSITKLAKHVRSHAGDRPYPCKFCDKSFTKSHHYTRHLRLKHGDCVREAESLRCEQCDDTFSSQDDLIYHSAIHATQNLTCPLCQEKFEDVDAVTAHIKTHVNGVEFMCDFCELIFTTKEKLNNHLMKAHEDEMQDDMSHDESSIENQEEDDEDDNDINVKDEGDHMLIEIKKPNEFLVNNTKEEVEDRPDITNSEESESETTYAELSTVNTMAILKKDPPILQEMPASKPVVATVKTEPVKIAVAKESKPNNNQTASILRRAEEMKRKVVQQTLHSVVDIKEEPATKVETTNTGGASDKSLRLLEKELQDLKRTNSRTEIIKNTPKSLEPIRNKRPQVHTSTPKLRMTEEKKLPFRNKSPAFDKKLPEKRVITKENKEPRESKEIKNNNGNNKEHKEKDTDKDVKDRDIKDKDIKDREIKDKDVKEKETPKSVIKNGSNSDKSNSEEGIRRSTRPSKIKNYAKMIRDRTQVEDNDETSEDDDDYEEPHKSLESRVKSRQSSQASKPAKQVKQKTPVAATVAATPRKRGRPRKVPAEVPAKLKKEGNEEADDIKKEDTTEQDNSPIQMETEVSNSVNDNNMNVSKVLPEQKATPSDVLVSPTGQTLKKVPIRALPPGVKPLPLPVNARPMATGELCEMQIGKKLVKVQKIVMTKAEVEAMAKKGLVEMKDGTMVLKQGIKLPATDPVAIKSTLFGDSEPESPNKSEKATPTRCDLGEDS